MTNIHLLLATSAAAGMLLSTSANAAAPAADCNAIGQAKFACLSEGSEDIVAVPDSSPRQWDWVTLASGLDPSVEHEIVITNVNQTGYPAYLYSLMFPRGELNTSTAPTPRSTIRLAASARRSPAVTVRSSFDMWFATTATGKTRS